MAEVRFFCFHLETGGRTTSLAHRWGYGDRHTDEVPSRILCCCYLMIFCRRLGDARKSSRHLAGRALGARLVT